MSGDRLSTRFAACAAEGRAALVTFVTAGDPDLATSAAVLRALVANGADIVELGMPFTDPMADGAVDPAWQYPQPRLAARGCAMSLPWSPISAARMMRRR